MVDFGVGVNLTDQGSLAKVSINGFALIANNVK
jgi:hypothetical protein